MTEKKTDESEDILAEIIRYLDENKAITTQESPPIMQAKTIENPAEFLDINPKKEKTADLSEKDGIEWTLAYDAGLAELEERIVEQTPYLEKKARSKPQKPKRRIRSIIANIAFWMIIIAMAAVILAGNVGGNKGARPIFGFAAMEVLSDSMQSEIPEGALIIVRDIGSDTLEIGDDIAYLREDNSIVTHRIVGIYENYNDSGQRGFETQGIENPGPDSAIVYAENVVGKVIWQMNSFASVKNWAIANWWICLLVVAGIVLAIVALKILLKKEAPEE